MNLNPSELLNKLSKKYDLNMEEAFDCANQMLQGKFADYQSSALLAALKTKGESISEIVGFSKALKFNARLPKTQLTTFIDVCGTGGDQLKTFNISTTTAFVLAGAGLTVAKHGNRSVSSQSGSADVLQFLGVDLETTAENQGKCLEEIGISFLFAPTVHPEMKNIMPLRKSLGIPTIFNVIGPLSNPLPLTFQIIGVYNTALMTPMIECMKTLGVKRGAVIHGFGGMDELSLEGLNQLYVLKDNHIETMTLLASDFGLTPATNASLSCSSVEESSQLLLSVLHGKQGPHYDIILFNAALALFISDKAKTIEEGLMLAHDSIQKGNALRTLEKLSQRTFAHE